MKPVRDKAYQASHHNFPCSFCGVKDETIVGHHLNIKGISGTGTKPSDALAIPVCVNCHRLCHEGKEVNQVEVWMKYALERLTLEYGQTEAVERLAMAYWSVL